MKKLYPLLSVLLLLIYWGCDDLFDPSVNLWGVDYSIENTTELYLLNSGLTGDIPSEIGNLTNLTFLDLHNNQLIGTIPPEIGNLTNLTSLRLDDNQLSGIIPDEICNQGDSSPHLSNNQLCPPYPSCIEDYIGEQDLSNCEGDFVELWGEYYSIENTTVLNLSNSGLTGEIPSEIGNLTNLTYLRLGFNQLTGEIPPEIGNLTNLTYLSLGFNQLTGEIPPEIWYMTNLTYLSLKSNQLTGSIPSEIGNLINLTLLYLYENQLTGEIPESICDLNINWSNLNFKIHNNKLCPPYPSCIEDYVGGQDTSDCD